ncbi:DUF503 domain-containing protein [Brevibacillus fulvus]|uniref:Uncharacterized protein YlxP (DUF503 family) n=1 Tax=Brevibacillus fulvus TaxID=1125967 RepID=A0A938Y197_9BACL|nr:DUF503 domain-containing protein [Brevibacillus fulvus]MBM7590579.1 uncharacterized protein YlxP (DUF503 family) [Brevibacillus fulvus]
MVGVARVELFLPACQNLKEKRAIVKSVIAQLRHKFNVSAAETDFQEQWQRTELVIAAVANEIPFLQKELNAVVRLVEMAPGVELIRAETEYYE